MRYQKFKFRADQTADIVFMRASEMTLIAAESYARNSELIKAVEQLNAVRIARKADPFVLGLHTEDEVIDEILIERRKELWGEGFALSDILRTQKAVVRNPALGTDDKPLQVTVITPDGSSKVVVAKQHTTLRFSDGTAFIPNSKYYLFSVPQTELNNNPNINK
ncbi:SusD family protein [compost metagenome]